jgi:hypothetical protein
MLARFGHDLEELLPLNVSCDSVPNTIALDGFNLADHLTPAAYSAYRL